MAASALAQLRQQVRDPAEAIRVACVAEAAAPKVGNVHPQAAFDDCDFAAFCAAAEAIAPILAAPMCGDGGDSRADQLPLGRRVLQAVTATRGVTSANVNLGIILLIAPLAEGGDREGTARVLAGLTPADGADVFRAIRLANPGGVRPLQEERSTAAEPAGKQWDVTAESESPIDLVTAMRAAADRDRIARQYATDFADFFENVVPPVREELQCGEEIGEAIVRAQLRLMAAERDTLIERKCGAEIAEQARRRAAGCCGPSWAPERRRELDRWLRSEGNRRNPGTTADLIAATLFQLVRPDVCVAPTTSH